MTTSTLKLWKMLLLFTPSTILGSDSSLLALYSNYIVPLVVDGNDHSLDMVYSNEIPIDQIKAWCFKHLDKMCNEDNIRSIVNKAHSIKEQHGELSRSFLSNINKDKNINLLSSIEDEDSVLKYDLTIEKPLWGELNIGESSEVDISWNDNSECISNLQNLQNNEIKHASMRISFQIKNHTCSSLINKNECDIFNKGIDKKYDFSSNISPRDREEDLNWYLLQHEFIDLDMLRKGQISSFHSNILNWYWNNIENIGNNLYKGYIKVEMFAHVVSSHDILAKAKTSILDINYDSFLLCKSKPIFMAHLASSSLLTPHVISVERGDRGGATVHYALLTWALCYQLGFKYHGSLRVIKSTPTPLFDYLGLTSYTHFFMDDVHWSVNTLKEATYLIEKANSHSSDLSSLNKLYVFQDNTLSKWMNSHYIKEHSFPLEVHSAEDGDEVYLMDKWFTKEFRQLMKSKLSPILAKRPKFNIHANNVNEKEGKSLSCAVHIRRGDVNSKDTQRYLHNQYYYSILQSILASSQTSSISEVNVHIFSESNSDVSFDIFDSLKFDRNIHCSGELKKDSLCLDQDSHINHVNIKLHLDSDIIEAWQYFIHADIFIMSKSSFSYVPALYRNSNPSDGLCRTEEHTNSESSESCSLPQLTLYPPQWHRPLSDWIITPPHLNGANEVPDEGVYVEHLSSEILHRYFAQY